MYACDGSLREGLKEISLDFGLFQLCMYVCMYVCVYACDGSLRLCLKEVVVPLGRVGLRLSQIEKKPAHDDHFKFFIKIMVTGSPKSKKK